MPTTREPAAPLRWGILGCASIAEKVIPAIRALPDCRVEAVASRDAAKARAWAAQRGIPRTFGSYAELLASGEVDVVYNPLPNSLHAEWTVRAIEAGLPVLCEKPFGRNAAEARAVALVAARSDVPVAEAFMYRFHPMWDAVLAAIRNGRIGTPTSVVSRFTFRMDSRTEVAAQADLAGGSLMDVGCYCVNLARRVAGCEPTRAFAFERRTTVDDTMFGQLEFPNGILAQFESSIESDERHGAVIAGTDGSLRIDTPWFPGLEAARFVLQRGEVEEVVSTPGGDGYLLEVEDFAAAVRGRKAPRWGLGDAIANMAAIDALYASGRTGAAVTVEHANAAHRGSEP